MNRLSTPFVAATVPFCEYPRPQLVRDSYLCLNGDWRLSCRRKGTERTVGTVRVPFPPESTLSGVEKTLSRNEQWIYERTFRLPDGFLKDRLLLHFGAADQSVRVFLNDREVGEHLGGYTAFTFDVTSAVCAGENRLRVEVWDTLSPDLPFGKQRKKRGGMWYTPFSGIWQTVWLESVPNEYIRRVRVTPTLDSVTVEVEGGAEEKCLILHTEDGATEYRFCGDSITLRVEKPRLWSPESPYLYDFSLASGTDEVQSYFALRTVSVGKVNGRERILLNGKPYFFHGLLDQGYFSDGLVLPASEEGYRFDVKTMKSLGFNTLRKHIKIEPEAFYYACDREGMLVFQDMVNNGRYSFLRDTALPTLGKKHRSLPRRMSKRRRRMFLETAVATVDQLYNHPCVVYYTIFNEGWGQHNPDGVYRCLKAYDRSRVWDATSGWFFGNESDVQSEHVYFKPIALTAQRKPLVLSEFGGYSLKLDDHSFNPKRTYGYRRFTDRDAFNEALAALYENEVTAAIRGGLCASILTQVSDVEDEVNGLVTYDRRVVKADEATMRRLASQLRQTFEENV
ncbi:MAG: glycoside hydrolase family 2 [Clostridia bacterium]|nr:glycoside hydrolase family 2 [Clostridia bacterium]